VLLGAAGVTAFLAHYSDTAIILAVVVLNGVIGFVQEYRATRTLEALRKLAPQTATVRRGGSVLQVETEELVPGDIVIVEAGVRVAADMRLLQCNEILADESLLTGESLPVDKTDSPLTDGAVALAESRNLLFAGSLIVEGRGEAAVFGTGATSELGRIAQTVSEVERADTPLQQRFHRFANLLTVGVVGLVLVATAIGLLRGMPFLEILLASIALAVSVVPEGLPVVVTVVLSSGARRMAEHKALVRRLAAAETLGSTEVICTDKTGTLTQNHMALRAVVGGPWHAEVREDAPLSCPDVQIADDTDCPGSETEFLPYLVETPATRSPSRANLTSPGIRRRSRCWKRRRLCRPTSFIAGVTLRQFRRSRSAPIASSWPPYSATPTEATTCLPRAHLTCSCNAATRNGLPKALGPSGPRGGWRLRRPLGRAGTGRSRWLSESGARRRLGRMKCRASPSWGW
jgi:magnesium-transporting ATPase (P-type)